MGAGYEKAVFLYRHRRYTLAREELGRELAAEPNSASAHALMSMCHIAESKFKLGRESAETAVAADPALAHTHYALAWLFYRDTQFVSARRSELLFLINSKPQHLRWRALKKARLALTEALRLRPQSADYHGLMAFINYDLRKYRQALASARQGLAIDPHHAESLKAAALASSVTQSVDEAIRASETAIMASPDGAVAHAIHGRTLLLAGRWEQALYHLSEAMRLEPDNPYIRTQFLEGLRSRSRLYRLQLQARRKGRWPIHRDRVRYSLLILLLAAGPTSLAFWIGHYLPSKKFDPALVTLSLAPVLALVCAREWSDFFLQFDPPANRLLPAPARSTANKGIGLYLFVLAIFTAIALSLSLSNQREPQLWVTVVAGGTVFVTFVLIELIHSRVK